MAHSFKETMLKGKNKEKVLILGRMVQPTQGGGKIIKLMVMGCTHGLMEENSKAVGKIIICTEEVYTAGLTDVYLKVNMLMIKRKVRVFTHGVMEDNTAVNGKMVNNMDKEYIDMRMVIVGQVFGTKVKEQCGLTKMRIDIDFKININLN